MLAFGAGIAHLASPLAYETCSPVTGEPLLAVDLTDGRSHANVPATDIAAARRALSGLPAVSIAVYNGELRGDAAPLRGDFDVVATSAAELETLVACVRRSPLAALALVQLLRESEARSIDAGLIAESLVYSMLQSGPEFAAWLAARPAPRVRETCAEPAVLAHREGVCLELMLNRPEKRNAFSAEMRDALVECLRIAQHDPSVERVVLRGAGASFCSGGDLDEFGTLPDPATAHAIRSTRNASRALAACAARTVAKLHGACVGAGAELPAFARHVVAAPNAFFQLPELSMGLVPGAGGTVSLPRRIGRQRTAWLALTGERIDPETALAWGLIDEIA